MKLAFRGAMLKRAKWSLLIFLCSLSSSGFSPYELYLSTGLERQVMLCAGVQADSEGALVSILRQLASDDTERALASSGIRDVVVMRKDFFGRSVVFVRFLYSGNLPYLGAAEAFENALVQVRFDTVLEPLIAEPKGFGVWHQMEWINHIRGDRTEGEPSLRVGIICEIIPEKEADYRSLHQSVWPGVVDQVVRGRIRDLGVFLLPLDGHLVEVLYLDYMGLDGAADDAANKADLTNQRWWRHTDACQRPLPGVEGGIWSGLEMVFPLAETVSPGSVP